MRTNADIASKMELLTGKNWPQGQASWRLLRDYQVGRRGSKPADLRNDLEEMVNDNWRIVENGDELGSTIAQAKVQTVIWMMENESLLHGLARMPKSGTVEGIRDRLDVVCTHYGIPIPESKGE